MIYLRSSDMSSAADVLQNLQIGNQVVADYEVILKSRPVVEDVIRELKLDTTVKELNKKVTVKNLPDTHIIQISARDTDPVMAMKITNSYLEYGLDSIRQIEIKEPFVVENAIVNYQKVAPSNTKNVIVGFLLGLMASVGFAIAKIILNDKLNSTDMVERTLGYPILSAIPVDSTMNYSTTSNKKGNRKRKK